MKVLIGVRMLIELDVPELTAKTKDKKAVKLITAAFDDTYEKLSELGDVEDASIENGPPSLVDWILS